MRVVKLKLPSKGNRQKKDMTCDMFSLHLYWKKWVWKRRQQNNLNPIYHIKRCSTE